jgi:hypothetical protein
MNALTRRDIRIYKASTRVRQGEGPLLDEIWAIMQVFRGSLALLPSTFLYNVFSTSLLSR